jgi:hypothetical protein
LGLHLQLTSDPLCQLEHACQAADLEAAIESCRARRGLAPSPPRSLEVGHQESPCALLEVKTLRLLGSRSGG